MGVLIMSLFPELPQIDEAKTIENVRYYFEVEFPKIIDRCSFSAALIKSPSFDTTGIRGSSKGNSQEDKVFGYLDPKKNEYDKFVEQTAKAIQDLSEPYKTILINAYFKGSLNIEIYRQMQYGPTRYSELKNTAFLKFAAKFESFYNLNVLKDEKRKDSENIAK